MYVYGKRTKWIFFEPYYMQDRLKTVVIENENRP